MRGQRREGGYGHVVVVISDLGAALVLCGGQDLGSWLAILVRNRTLRVAVVRPYWACVRTMCGSRTGGWSLPCVMSD
jgi:hypothetical protein